MLKIRRPLGRLIFNMGIAIPGKTVFLIETAPRIVPWLRAWHDNYVEPRIKYYTQSALWKDMVLAFSINVFYLILAIHIDSGKRFWWHGISYWKLYVTSKLSQQTAEFAMAT